MKAVDRAEADQLAQDIVGQYDVDAEGLEVSAHARREATARGWSEAKTARAALTAFILIRQGQGYGGPR